MAGGTGAAIWMRTSNDGFVHLEDVRFRDNTATQGGALYIEAGSFGTANGCTFENNTALLGGAIFATWPMDQNFIVQDTAFIDNIGSGAGGAVLQDGEELDLVIDDSNGFSGSQVPCCYIDGYGATAENYAAGRTCADIDTKATL
jgi:predicted outer membrane repeat protein